MYHIMDENQNTMPEGEEKEGEMPIVPAEGEATPPGEAAPVSEEDQVM